MSVRYASQSGTNFGRGPRTSLATPFCQRVMTPAFTPNTSTSSTFWGVTTGGTAHAVGGWGVANFSTFTIPARFDLVLISNTNVAAATTNSATLIDIGVGPSGSEVAVASGIAVGGSTGGSVIPLPIAYPAGTRVVIRARSARTNLTMYPQLFFYDTGSFAQTPTSVDVIGTSTATSAGTALSGASGSYVEIIASTAKDYQSIILIPSLAAGVTAVAQATNNLSLAVGPAGSEQILTEVMHYTLQFPNPSISYAPISSGYSLSPPVRAGSRVSVRHNIAANPERVAVCLIGVPYV